MLASTYAPLQMQRYLNNTWKSTFFFFSDLLDMHIGKHFEVTYARIRNEELLSKTNARTSQSRVSCGEAGYEGLS